MPISQHIEDFMIAANSSITIHHCNMEKPSLSALLLRLCVCIPDSDIG
ncbi:hypothetical protein QSI_3208 [Clostridioides difficile P28]|nr:hypothetical protein QSI_3208 [Clostridioides difficile P28]